MRALAPAPDTQTQWLRRLRPRIKRINSGRLTSRTFGAQQNEVAILITIANRNKTLARPVSVRVH